MPTAARDPSIAAILKRPFAEQVAFFRGKLGNLVPTATWRDIWQSQHDRAFMVAGAARADLLADLAGAVDKAIADGETLEAFRRRFLEIVQRSGWKDFTGDDRTKDRPKGGKGLAWRTRVIYQTNLAASYSAGRLAQLKAAGFRYYIYKHSDAVAQPRPQHLAWNGLTLPADHPFWRTHWPPNGWGCRCRVIGANGPETARLLGGDPDKALPPGWDSIDSKTKAPPGIDEGWGYQPGATVAEDVARAVAKKTIAWPYEIAKAYMSDVPEAVRDALATAVRAQPETGEAVRRFAERALGDETARRGMDQYVTMGPLTRAQAEAIAQMTGVEAVAREMYDWALDQATVRKVMKDHGDDAAEARRGQTAVAAEDYRLLPAIIAAADRIEYGGTSDVGRHVVRVVKAMDGVEYVAAFEVRSGRRMVALQSMWKRGRPPALRP